MNYEHLAVYLFFAGLIAFREVMSWRREKDLLDRLAARDLPELVTYQTERRRAEIPPEIARQHGIPL